MFLFFLLMVPDNEPFHISKTEIYQIMLDREVFVRPNGEVYILNFDQSRIQHYDVDGTLLRNIGRRGQGPGEFTFPTYATLVDDFLYIYDELTGLISVFAADGEFVRQVSLPPGNFKVQRAKNGWLFWQQKLYSEENGSQLQWSADDFENLGSILTLSDVGWDSGTHGTTDSTGKTFTVFSPLSMRPSLAVSPDGTRCYFVADPKSFKIAVIEGGTGKLLNYLVRNEKRIPFDREWGDAAFEEETAEHIRRSGISPNSIVKLYPDYFPVVRSLKFDPEGNLVVSRWRGRPDKNFYLVAFNALGEEVPVKYDYKTLIRIAGVANGYGYVTVFNGDEAALARVPVAQINAFAEANPITDWSFSRSMSISK